MSGKPTLYEILGVSETATDDEIKKAFRQLALKFHPDKNSDPAAWAKFVELKEARDVLLDPKLRVVYDKHGDRGLRIAKDFGTDYVDYIVLWTSKKCICCFLCSLACCILPLLAATCVCFCYCCCFCCCNFCCGRCRPMFQRPETSNAPTSPRCSEANLQ